jgi:hypothetical protein
MWTSQKIAKLSGKFVRLTGLLMLDTAHVHHSKKANNDDRDHAGTPLKRATNWEVHPVAKLEVCDSTLKNCRKGNGWKDVP